MINYWIRKFLSLMALIVILHFYFTALADVFTLISSSVNYAHADLYAWATSMPRQ